MEDRKLLNLLKKDPNAGMEMLVTQYSGLVWTVSAGYLSAYPREDVEDCVAEVFSDFYRAYPRFDPKKASLKSYLCVLARNNARDLMRRAKPRDKDMSRDDSAPGISMDTQTSPEDSVMDREQRREILLAIRDLGEPDSQILLRKFLLGQSSKEIAGSLGLSPANVDTRTSRAIVKLRQQFGGA